MLNGTEETAADLWKFIFKSTVEEEAYSSKIIFSVSLLLVFVASLIGNTLTCIVIYSNKTMHTATNCYLFNLAISDLLVTFPILLIVYQMLIQQIDLVNFNFNLGIWYSKFFMCIHYVFVMLFWNNGILVMTALSIERYIAICYPMMLKGTPVWKRVTKNIVAIWAIAILETLPHIWTIHATHTDEAFMCYTLPTRTTRIITGVSALFTFLLPLCIMTFVYTMIAFKVNDKEKYALKDMVYRNGFKRQNVNKLIALTVSFVICWLPFFVIRMMLFITDVHLKPSFQQWFAIAHKVAMFNSWFTTVLNPLLFSLISIKFRKALKMLWEQKNNSKYETKGTPRRSQSKTIY